MCGLTFSCIVFVFPCFTRLNRISSKEERKTKVNCSQCSAFLSALARTHVNTRAHLSPQNTSGIKAYFLLWEKWCDRGGRGGLEQLISPDVLLFFFFSERKRRKPAAQSIHEESASSGLLAQSAAVPIVLPHTHCPGRCKRRKGGRGTRGAKGDASAVLGGKVDNGSWFTGQSVVTG